MQSGDFVEEGPAEAVFSAATHPYTRPLLAATPGLDAALRAREAEALSNP